MSFTTFSIGTAQIYKNEISKGGIAGLTIPVSNTGKKDGTEIIQVYIRKTKETAGPLKTLRGFRRVNIPAGKTSDVTIDLPKSAFEFFDRTSGKMAVTPGEYEIWYGSSSDTKDLKLANTTIL